MKSWKGEITVFLSLALLLVLALVGTCLESARAAGLTARISMTADSSLRSAFAAYDRELWEQYGLLFLADRDGEASRLSEWMFSYAEKNSAATDMGVDWFSFQVEAVEPRDVIYATGCHGQVFQQAVAEYMSVCGLGETVGELFLQLGLTDESGALTATGRRWQLRGGEEELDLEQIWTDYEEICEEAEQLEVEDTPAEEIEDTVGVSQAEAEAAVEAAMGTVSDLIRYGLLSFVVADVSAVSDESLGGEELPSSLPDAQREGLDWALREDNWLDRLLFYEYVIRYLDFYTTENDRGCQVEYVIAGKNSDRKNLSSVAMRLFALRYILNQAAAFTDPEKQAEAQELATVALGWTGIVPLVEGLTVLLLVVLALGESMLDVRALLAGGHVVMMKSPGSWRLSFQNLSSVFWDFSLDGETEEGLSYEDYLRILLLLNSQEGIIYRTMDVIQRQICETEPDFRMSRCVYASRAVLRASAFPIFPFLPGNLDYVISREAEYGYYTNR